MSGAVAVIGAVAPIIRLSGVLSAGSAGTPVTSATRTISGAGKLKFTTLTNDTRYSLNGGAYSANIAENTELTVANGDTIAVQADVAISSSATFKLLGNNSLIENVSLDRA